MIESTIIEVLKADPELSNYVTEYAGQPAIFSNDAPEDAVKPFIVIEISRLSGPESIIQIFSISVDCLDRNVSRVNMHKAGERVEFALDNKYFQHERYNYIRPVFDSAGYIKQIDVRDIFYNVTFDARATRKKWMQQLT